MAEGQRKDSWGEEELMRLALERAGKQPPARKPAGQQLSLKERVFVEAYLRTGKKQESAQIAGYKNPAGAAYRALKRPRVQEALREAVVERVDASKLSRTYVLEKHLEIVESDNLFARIKSLEQISKLQGYFAPIKHQTIAGQEGNPYAQLVETLRAQGASFTEEERMQLRVQLIGDLAAVQEALALLGGGEGVN